MSKHEEARKAGLEAQERGDESLPEYSATHPQGPTAESPFNFPSNESRPALVPTSSSAPSLFQRPIAIPQVSSDKAAPFLDAYTRLLLQYGITPESWRAFLNTMSAFLAAKVSDQAVSHAADMGRRMGDVPKRFGQDTVDHAKSVGNSIRGSAKSGNYLGAAMGVVGGAISLPVGTAFRAAGAALSLPSAAFGAVTQKPRTPRERAAAYAAAANKKWLGGRGLRAGLVTTAELAEVSGVPVRRLLDLARASADRSAAAQVDALKEYISGLETFTGSALDLGASTLWLIIVKDDEPAEEVEGAGKRKV